ncbi:MAG: HmuY family protein [Gemmatimonadota bacterium]
MPLASHAERQMIIASVIVALLVAIAVVFVAGSLDRPRPPEFAPSPVSPQEVGADLAGPHLYTIDATHEREWRYFDFSRGSRIDDPEPVGWDLAFRRIRIIVNGGKGFPGRAGVVDLGEVAFERIDAAPSRGYQGTTTGRDSVQSALEEWYDYGFTSHVLEARPRVYAIRTADGRYAKLQVLSYYCPGARAGCLTFRYVYQGDGSPAFVRSIKTSSAGR